MSTYNPGERIKAIGMFDLDTTIQLQISFYLIKLSML